MDNALVAWFFVGFLASLHKATLLPASLCVININMKKVMIVGCAGAGKSTLSRRLGSLWDLPVVHLDAHFWQSGWVKTPDKLWREKVKKLAMDDSWIVDGNYVNNFDLTVPNAEQIIFLDFPLRICLWRLLKRRIQYHKRTRPDLAAGCEESINYEFYKWVFNYKKQIRPKVLRLINQLGAEKKLLVLQSPKQVTEYLESVKKVATS